MGRLGNPSSRAYATPTYATTQLTARETFGGNSKAGLGRHIGMGPFTYSAIVNASSGHQASFLAGNSFPAAFRAGNLLDKQYPISETNQLARVGTGTTGGMTRTPADGVNSEQRKEMQKRVDAWNEVWPSLPIRDTPNKCCQTVPFCKCLDNERGYKYFSILSSTNGEQWSLKAGAPADEWDLMNDVYYGNGTWVAVGSGLNPILYSTDNAETWVAATSVPNSPPSIDYYSSVHYANNTWVAVGSATYPIIYSTDGQTWSPGWFQQSPNIPVFVAGQNRTIYYGNGTWVAVGSTPNSILYSTDNAQTWSTATGDDFGPQGSGNSVYYDNGVWVAVGFNFINGTNILYSANGQSWTKSYEVIGGGGGAFDVYYGNGTWVVVGSGSTPILYSTDNGLNWVASVTPPAFSSLEGGNQVYYGNGTWVAVGTAVNTSSSCIFTATNPDTWTPASGANGSLFSEQFVTSVYYSGNKWVACGGGLQINSGIIYSADGQSWTSVSAASENFTSLAGSNIYYDNGKWIIAGLFST